MAHVDATFITTIYNEENSIREFMDSVLSQSVLPREIIIVDADSADKTLTVLKNTLRDKKYSKVQKVAVRILIKRGNRAVGRNYAIENGANEIILVSDAGCALDYNWVKHMSSPFVNKKIDVVSGYYIPVGNTVFQRALGAYTSVMLDKIDQEEFLPSSRSIAFRRSAWKRAGGYPEKFDTCEDLVFAARLKHIGARFYFAPKAVVYWPQKKNIVSAFGQFYSYALGDGMARYFRPQTPLLYGRYVIAFILVVMLIKTHNRILFQSVFVLFFLYCFWAIYKNYRYVKSWRAVYVLPALQFTADAAVLLGTTVGFLKSFVPMI